jgi:hypothetical protein
MVLVVARADAMNHIARIGIGGKQELTNDLQPMMVISVSYPGTRTTGATIRLATSGKTGVLPFPPVTVAPHEAPRIAHASSGHAVKRCAPGRSRRADRDMPITVRMTGGGGKAAVMTARRGNRKKMVGAGLAAVNA